MDALLHALGGTPVVGHVLAAVCGWVLLPAVTVCTVALSVLTIQDRPLRGVVPYSVLTLLCILMVRDILRGLV